MGDNKLQSLTYAFNQYVRPYMNPGNPRGTYGSFYPSSSVKLSAKKKKGKNAAGKTKDRKKSAAAGGSLIKKAAACQEQQKDMEMPGTPEREDTPQTAGMAGLEPAPQAERDGGLPNSSQGFYLRNDSQRLQEAVLWSEILGEPVSKKRRRKRMGQQNGN